MKFITREELKENYKLYLKIVISTRFFDNYNSFFNIYGESEEACRRILIITPYENLEEVEDVFIGENIKKYSKIENNIWIDEYPLTLNPNKIDLDNIKIDFEKIKELI